MAHNKEKIYYEYLAKLLLEEFLPNVYHDLIISDKPDLKMGNNHGVEVTRALDQGDGQASGIFQHLKMKPKDKVDPRHLQTFDRIGYKLLELDGIIGGYGPCEAVWINDELLKLAFNKKVKKAASYILSAVDLFIHSPFCEWFEEDVIRDFMNWTNDHGGSAFSKIIVSEMPGIYVYSIKEAGFTKISVDENIYRLCCETARDIACNAN